LRTKNDLPLDAQIKDMRQQIDNGKFMGVEFLLTFGVNDAKHYENYYALMRDAAAYAQERGSKVVLKPHGGGSGAAEEIQRCLDKVEHPNFKIWYDAGNIIFYTGKDPLEQLKPIARHVTGFCAKDCDKQRGSVWLEFGKGAVDFPAVFSELKRAGFHGPVMVECCAQGDTPEAVTENARKNREFLERTFAAL
jgi:sugar phosphate isomerase/epimerase